MTTLSRFLQAAALTVCGVAAVPASAEELVVDLNFGWLSVGTDYTISEGHFFWVGEFSGTATDLGAGTILDHASLRCPAWVDTNFVTGTISSGGYCIVTLTSGDSFQVAFAHEGSLEGATGEGVHPLGTDGGHGTGTVIGGTGALEGITGFDTFEAYTVLFHPDGKSSGYSMLHYTLQIP